MVGSREVRYELIYLFFAELLRDPQKYLPKSSYSYTITIDGYRQRRVDTPIQPISVDISPDNQNSVFENKHVANSQAEADQSMFVFVKYFANLCNRILIVSTVTLLSIHTLTH